MGNGPIRRAFVALVAMTLTTTGLAGVSSRADAAPTDLTLIIESIVEIDDPEDGITDGDCWGDYVFEVAFSGSTSTSPEFSIDPGFGTGCAVIRPTAPIPVGYAVSRTADTSDVGIPLEIEVRDVDTVTSDEVMDVSPVPGETTLRLSVDPFLGGFSIVDSAGQPVSGTSFPGGVTSALIEGDGDGDRAGLNIRIEATGANDADGDGLLDSWETIGFDADGDGDVDIDLSAMGADPNRKDLFVELDTANGRVLGRDDIQAVKNAFAVAPISNPDGSTGVNLWVDTGGAVDPDAREGQPLGTCGDGIDNAGDGTTDGGDPDCAASQGRVSNYLDASVEDPGTANCANGSDDDGDGLSDGDDPDCIVGDDFGGGNAITTNPAICNLDGDFYSAKAANFDAADRAPIFRYAISTPGTASCESGGQAEIGGNDFVDHNGDGGTIMHELGHNLTLRHGGFEDDNCKPNHVSVMNYFNQFGIGRVGGGAIIDYAPVRRGLLGGPRSTDLLSVVLDEANLAETTPVDASDTVNRFVFTNGAGASGWTSLAAQPDWNGVNGIETGAIGPINIDTSDSSTGNPDACTNTENTDVHDTGDEWAQISVPFRQFGDSANGALNPGPVDEPTLEELEELVQVLTRTDLAAAGTDDPDPVAAGTEVSVTSTASNEGSAPADAVTLSLSADPRLTPSTLPPTCAVVGSEVRCGLGTIEPGGSASVEVPFVVAADLVHVAGGPALVETQVLVSHAGDDPDAADDAMAEQTQVVAVADLRVGDLTVMDQPAQLVLGDTASVTLEASVANAGPSDPMDADVTLSATGPGVTGAGSTVPVTALTVAGDTATGTVDVTCEAAGPRTITFSAEIAPAEAADTDPSSGNDSATNTVTIDCAVPVAIDVGPGAADDELPVSSRGNAFVGVFTTEAGEYGLPAAFDATSIVDDSLRLGRSADLLAGGGLPPRFADEQDLRERGPEERGRDGDLDKRLRFVREDVPLSPGDTEVCVMGRFVDDTSTELTLFGCSDVTVVARGSG